MNDNFTDPWDSALESQLQQALAHPTPPSYGPPLYPPSTSALDSILEKTAAAKQLMEQRALIQNQIAATVAAKTRILKDMTRNEMIRQMAENLQTTKERITVLADVARIATDPEPEPNDGFEPLSGITVDPHVMKNKLWTLGGGKVHPLTKRDSIKQILGDIEAIKGQLDQIVGIVGAEALEADEQEAYHNMASSVKFTGAAIGLPHPSHGPKIVPNGIGDWTVDVDKEQDNPW